jgi:hypothetical protein
MAPTVVHRAAPSVVPTVLRHLRDRGVEAFAVDDPGPLALIASFGTYRVRIAVPHDEVDEARRILAEWDRASAPHLRELTREVRAQFLLATGIALLVGAALLVARALPMHWVLVGLVPLWAVLVVVLGARSRAGADRHEEAPPE